jgi:L-methionine (R)-S-oxide reductase
MFTTQAVDTTDKTGLYREAAAQLTALLAGEADLIANAANTSALITVLLPDLNWAGFYFLKEGELVLGPFQGKPACVRIPLGRGVCGTAASLRETQRVDDVHAFPGHIACDAASRSELVVPLAAGDRLIGVLDLDSPIPARFDAADQAGVEALAAIFLAASKLLVESR